jgi:predicted ATP-grasp superfamily ATP-dependent carboligase
VAHSVSGSRTGPQRAKPQASHGDLSAAFYGYNDSMPHVLLYEYLTSGGSRANSTDLEHASLRREGLAMLSALASDFAAIEGVERTVILDAAVATNWPASANCRVVRVDSQGGDCDALAAHCRDADWTVVIAPDFDQILESRLALVERSGGRLLGPSSALAALAANKQRVAEHLAASAVPTATGTVVDVADLAGNAGRMLFPEVVKPIDGCGSEDVWLLRDLETGKRVANELLAIHGPTKQVRLERYYPGIAASVALLCGPASAFPLPACGQRLSTDGRFRYLGGRCPLDPRLAARAESLATRAIRSLQAPLGY